MSIGHGSSFIRCWMSFSKVVFLFASIFLLGCAEPKPEVVPAARDVPAPQPEPTPTRLSFSDQLDSLARAVVDTSTLEGQRELARNRFQQEFPMSDNDIDTMLDLNYDGHLDLVWYDYYASGTGFKYHDIVFLYRPRQRTYVLDTLLSSGINTSYFLDRKKITNFYIPHGGGTGYQLEWIKGSWVRTLEVDEIAREDKMMTWEIRDLRTGKRRLQKGPFDFGAPPKDVLETIAIDR